MMTHAASASSPHAVDRENPWPGLAPYEEGDFDFFKGREEEIAGVLRRIMREDLTLLWGYSGLGKTSLLRAGLFPRLRESDVFPVYIRLRYERPVGSSNAGGPEADAAVLREQCFEAIRRTAERWQCEVPTAVASGTIWEYVRRRADRFWGTGDRLVTPLLVFDQFEELFTHDRGKALSAEGIQAFFRDLSDAITGSPPEWLLGRDVQRPEEETQKPASEDTTPDPAEGGDYLYRPGVFKVLLSFREDFLAQVAGFHPLIRAIDHNYYRLESLSFQQALTIVDQAGGHLLDDSRPGERAKICQRIVERVAGAPSAAAQTSASVDPALLSLFCAELNEERRKQKKPVIDRELVESGETSQIISKFYDTCMTGVSDAAREFVEGRLVLAESRSRESQAEASALEFGVSQSEIDFLISRRILRREETTRRQPRLELTHDVLIEPALASRERRRAEQLRQLAEQEQRDRLDRERDVEDRARQARELVLLQERLQMAEQLSTERDRAEQEARARQEAERRREAADHARLQRELELQQERAAAKASLAHRRRVYVLVLAAAVVVSAVLAVAAMALAREVQTRFRIQAANSQLSTDPKLATLFSARATEAALSQRPEVLSLAHVALSRAVREASHLQSTYAWKGSGRRAAISADGARLALVRDGLQQVEIRHGENFSQSQTIHARKDHTIFAGHFLDNGALALAYENGAVEVVRGSDGAGGRLYLAAQATVNSEEQGTAPVTAGWGFDPQQRRVLLVRVLKSSAPGAVGESGRSRRWLSIADLQAGRWLSHVEVDPAAVGDLVVADDGGRYAVIDQSGRATVHETLNDRPIATHAFGRSMGLRMSSDGSYVAGIPGSAAGSTSEEIDPLLVLWSVSSRESWELRLPGRGGVLMSSFSPDGRTLAVVQAPGIAQAWNLQSRRPLFAVPIEAQRVVFSTDGQELLSWDHNNNAQLWMLGSGTELLTLTGHKAAIIDAVVNPRGRPIVTLSTSEVNVWSRHGIDTAIPTGHGETFRAVALSHDGRLVAAAAGNRVLIAEVAQPSNVREIPVRGEVTSLAFSPDGARVAVGTHSGVSIHATAEAGPAVRELSHGGGTITDVQFGTDGSVVAYAIEFDGSRSVAVISDTSSGASVEWELTGRILSVALGSDERRLVVGLSQRPTYVTGTAEHVSFDMLTVDSAARDTNHPAGTHDENPKVPLPPPAEYSGAAPTASRGERELRPAADISRDLRFAVSATLEGELIQWTLADQQQQTIPFGDDVAAVAVSPDGAYFAAAGLHGSIKLYSRGALNDPVLLQPSGPAVQAIAFSSTGDHLASARADGTLMVFPVGIEELLRRARTIKDDITESECAALGDLCSAAKPTWRGLLRQLGNLAR